ncbi:MAG: hypothetical protein IKH27_12480 [Oscillospiraceae bacterium]|nr:hypothetical protein [Oscillospiraceae bacterium]MBR3448610.1 hypothetical protein [Oscillospiraceae bacterium]
MEIQDKIEELADLLENRIKQYVPNGTDAIRKFWGAYKLTAVMRSESKQDKCIQEYGQAEDLLDDEITAAIYQVGAFSVRISKNVCEGRYPNDWAERTPAPAEVIQNLREKENKRAEASDFESDCPRNCRIEIVVSACRHSGIAPAKKYQYICHAQPEWHGWCETIGKICAVRLSRRSDQDALIVNKHFFGDSHSAEHWYAFFENGKVEGYSIDC